MKRWTPEEIALLGTDTDAAIAARLGRSTASVGLRRNEYCIPNIHPRKHRVAWRPEWDAVVGTATDREIAERIGMSLSAVRFRRYELGRPAFAKVRPRRAWLPEWDRMLGTIPDEVIARQLDRGICTVRARRIALGIRKPPGRVAAANALRELPDAAFTADARDRGGAAARLGISQAIFVREQKRRGLFVSLLARRNGLRRLMVLAAWRHRPQPSMAEIGKAVGLTMERVRQIIAETPDEATP